MSVFSSVNYSVSLFTRTITTKIVNESPQICQILASPLEYNTELNVREWTCLNCGSVHDRDVNAAINILNASNQLETIETRLITKVEEIVETENPVQLNLFNEVADGQSETQQKRTRSRRNSTRKKVVDSNDVSTRSESFKQLSLFE